MQLISRGVGCKFLTPRGIINIMQSKKCEICETIFSKPLTCSQAIWDTKRRFCSRKCMGAWRSTQPGVNLGRRGQIAWNKGKKLHYPVWNKGEIGSTYAKEHGYGKWMTGKKQSPETRRKKSEVAKQRVAEGKHNFYIDGRTTGNRAIRTSLEYKLWRTAVFERDNYTCIWCGARSGNGYKVVLHADHIKPFAYFPELRFAIDNGRTLCVNCHKTTDTYAGKATKKRDGNNQ